MKKVVLIFVMTAFCALYLKAQHRPMYSQYMFNQLVINPAYTGSRDVLSTTALYRHQWAGLKGAPRTQSFYLHSPLPNPKNNFGLSFVFDRLGVTYTNSFNFSYAYRLDLGKGRLAFGLQAGLSTLQNRYSEVITDTPGDAVFAGNSRPIAIPGLGFGAYYDTKRFYLGFSLPYLLQYRSAGFQVFVKDEPTTFQPALLTTGCLIRLNPDLLLRPSILFKYIPNSPMQLDLNANLIIKESLWIGASFRTRDALVGMLEYQINPQFRLGYAYDYSVTTLQHYNTGSHELMLRYEFGYRVKAMSPRYF
jgi:type IX secretion system PorP/SprF family membrane protein